MSSVLYNPKQVINRKEFDRLTQNLDGIDFKPKSRADSFNRHQLGGQISYFNFCVLERKREKAREQNEYFQNNAYKDAYKRHNDPKFPDYDENPKQFFQKKIGYNSTKELNRSVDGKLQVDSSLVQVKKMPVSVTGSYARYA